MHFTPRYHHVRTPASVGVVRARSPEQVPAVFLYALRARDRGFGEVPGLNDDRMPAIEDIEIRPATLEERRQLSLLNYRGPTTRR